MTRPVRTPVGFAVPGSAKTPRVRPLDRCQIDHRGEFRKLQGAQCLRQSPSERRRPHRQSEAARIGHDCRQRAADHAILEAAAAGLFDVLARDLDQVHVVDAGRACRHAREARKAAIDVRRDFGLGIQSPLEHVLDGIDAAARTVALIAEDDVGRARRRAQSAMNAAAQNAVGFRYLRIFELRFGKAGVHRA